MKYPEPFIRLIEIFKKLPGVGKRSAERFAFQLLAWQHKELEEFTEGIRTIQTQIDGCPECGCMVEVGRTCHFCHSPNRDCSVICVIAHQKDAYAIEETAEYKGLYHVLGGLLSPLEGIGPDSLTLPLLKDRLQKAQIKEVVLALDSTLEGDATALYLKKELQPFGIALPRLSFGLPMGSSLDYVDGSTLGRALIERR